MFDEPDDKSLHARIAPETEALPPPPWTLVGRGVWASVHDLGDGTILKVVRKHGGLGSGESKLFREGAALRLLGGLSTRAFRAPRLIAEGSFDNAYFGSGPPLAGWLRIERLPGGAIREEALYGMKTQERERAGEEIGAAIAEFHAAAARFAEPAAKFGDSLLRTVDEALSRISAAGQRGKLERLKEMWRAEEAAPVFVHGDLNLANMLRSRDAPVSLVDFAEAGVAPREADLKHFDQPGPMRDAIFRGYTAVSGVAVDQRRYRMAVAANAAATLAIGGNGGHPRDALRRSASLDEALRQAGVDA